MKANIPALIFGLTSRSDGIQTMEGRFMRAIIEKRAVMIATTLSLTAGCAMQSAETGGTANQIGNIPANVVALADPNQDISTARLLPDDGCFWYEHRGPVETTLVPLRSPEGNPICAAREA
ncbi:hypothetical protein [Roseovarius dicentrarchi]|uniref:hypothetical protein n=1 Tax=Roseovarius dicentrarchi TaxID=2250573 RepID=UPI0030844C93